MGSHMDGVASSLGQSELLPPLLRNFSENQRLKQASYFCFNSLHSGPSEFISKTDFDRKGRDKRNRGKWCTKTWCNQLTSLKRNNSRVF